MSEDFYAALMMRRTLPTTIDITTIKDPGIYPVTAGNSTAPGSLAGLLFVLLPQNSPVRKFIAVNSWNVYTYVDNKWQGLGNAAIADITEGQTDITPGRLLKVGDYGLTKAILIPKNTDLAAFLATARGAFYHCDNSTGYTNAPNFGANWFDIYMTIHEDSNYRTLLAIGSNGLHATAAITGKSGDGFTFTDWTYYLPLSGGTLTNDASPLILKNKTQDKSLYVIGRNADNTGRWFVGCGDDGNNDVTLNNYSGGNNNITLKANGDIYLNTNSSHSVWIPSVLRLGNAVNSGALFIGDADSGLKNSVDGAIDLWANNAKVGYWNPTILSHVGQMVPGNYGNFDARYVQDVRLGGQGSGILGNPNPFQVPAGCVMTGWYTEGSNPGGDTIYYKPIQKNKNGAWVTISG